ncbi:hypothetical protein RhiJN_02073 [Ceratobasidium sp. AG-Ba]|nr:hypothetical protein RhiJN_02073 [Ceratobasidium sp. AG-Ba]QRW03005.1 hypothetical protein RhiLY_02004 [Ceratobasidium sp. AG-Ba]
MSAIDNLGGFVAPAANGQASPVSVRPSEMPLVDLAEGPSQRPNTNPFRSSFSGPSMSGYPDQAPPSYDSVASTSPTPTPVLPEKGGANFSPGPTPIASSSAQPQQFLLGDNSHSSDLGRSLSTKKAERSEPEYPVASTSTAVVRAQPGALTGQAVNNLTSSRNPLDPLPACFSRVVLPPSETTTYERLPNPFVIHGKPGKTFLDDAFVVEPLPAFHKHDVETDDWMRFLDDVVTVAKFNGGQKAVAAALPVTKHLLFVGRLASMAVEHGMKKQNIANVVDLLNTWNERFFGPRRLSVVLCKGNYRYSGTDRDLPAPDRPHATPRVNGHHDDDSSSSDSDSYSGRSGRRGRGAARREDRRSRRSERRTEKKAKSREAYRLVVVSTN